MEAPPNLNATAQPIESNENKMSCRTATSVDPRQLHRRSAAPRSGRTASEEFEEMML